MANGPRIGPSLPSYRNYTLCINGRRDEGAYHCLVYKLWSVRNVMAPNNEGSMKYNIPGLCREIFEGHCRYGMFHVVFSSYIVGWNSELCEMS